MKSAPLYKHPIFKRARRPSLQRFNKAFDPFALEIGHLTRAWNGLHENMGMLFAQLVNPNNTNIPTAVWHSVQSDKTQRDMLVASAQAFGAINQLTHPWGVEAVKFLVKETNSFAGQRNNAIHAPLSVNYGVDTLEFNVEPNWYRNNPKAQQLKEKDLLKELRWYRLKAETLNQYCLAVWFHLRQQDGSSPQKPLMPTLGQAQIHRPSSRRSASRSAPLPPRSSPA